MRGRWQQLRANAGRGGLIRVGVVGVLLVLVPLWMFVQGVAEAPYLVLAILGGLALPALLRRPLAADPQRSSASLRYGGYGLAALAFTSSLWREYVPDMVVALAVFGAIALYISAYFWLFSDPSVVRFDEPPG